jgi:hypothetical protein
MGGTGFHPVQPHCRTVHGVPGGQGRVVCVCVCACVYTNKYQDGYRKYTHNTHTSLIRPTAENTKKKKSRQKLKNRRLRTSKIKRTGNYGPIQNAKAKQSFRPKDPGVQREKSPQRDHDQDLKTPKIPGTLTNNADQSGVAKCQMAGRERNGADEA